MEIKEVVAAASRVDSELERLRSRVRLAVMFVDLVGSTEYKAKNPREEIWLPRLAKFLLGVTRIVEAEGRVVKYIGDEVMAVFNGEGAVLAAEHAAEKILQFCEKLPNEALQVKIAIDFGEVSLLDFSAPSRGRSRGAKRSGISGDPNGLVVDRCARIASKGVAGVVLCSADFRAASSAHSRWVSVGAFRPKGFLDRVEVFRLQSQAASEFTIVDDKMTLKDCEAELDKVKRQLEQLKQLRRRAER